MFLTIDAATANEFLSNEFMSDDDRFVSQAALPAEDGNWDDLIWDVTEYERGLPQSVLTHADRIDLAILGQFGY